MSIQTITVRGAAPADTDTLAATLAEAFQSDPVLSWCYPDVAARARILPTAFRVILEAAIPHGGVETALGGVAASVWVPPTAEIDDERMVGDLATASEQYADRMFTAMGLLDEHHPTHREHQYLFILGTRDAWQSQGLGTALLRSVLSGCDRDGVPAYLEATSERNRSLYERHGFETTKVIRLPDGPPLWCMWREPA
ncbi:GNAT family N-acetyltransferase [Jiangella asiatica]|uniref:GNAT family N-acetyltransferase n=1 Tax=Jiangella asiatica TaxID=2530372 RepID=A0A4R5CY59_9ACTN|nr:GNAT family N-acetyltransferase [Jiangella asiatica]TDE02793.1 GNAT family N-acetyltransferase [Jiangella asiatica]